MTDKPSPKEIDDLVYELRQAGKDDTYSLARAVLAKWGQPAQAAEPVARLVIGKTKGGVSLTHMVVPAAYQLQEGTYALYTTPQPTQTQAVAVPLTCEWTHNEDDGFWETACGEAWRFDDGGPGENNMHFCHSCGNSLRIKGGQHGTE